MFSSIGTSQILQNAVYGGTNSASSPGLTAPSTSKLVSAQTQVAKSNSADMAPQANFTLLGLRDTHSKGMASIAFVQIESSALTGLADKLGNIKSAIEGLSELATGSQAHADQSAQLSSLESAMSTYIGDNISVKPKLAVIALDGAETQDSLSQADPTLFDYMTMVNVPGLQEDSIREMAILEINLNDVMNAWHDPATCSICSPTNPEMNALTLATTTANPLTSTPLIGLAASSQTPSPPAAAGVAGAPLAAPTTTTTVTQATSSFSAQTGINYVDALTGSSTWDITGGGTVSYSYYNGTVGYDPATYGGAITVDDNAVDISAHASDLDAAFAALSDASGLGFDAVTEIGTTVGEIRVAYSSAMPTTSFGTQAAAFAYYPSSATNGGDMWFGTPGVVASNASFAIGTYGFYTALHELGHAVGLSHPFVEGGGAASSITGQTLPSANDNRRYTMMSYNQNKAYDRNAYIDLSSITLIDSNGNGAPDSASWSFSTVNGTTPMLYDAAALEAFYGPSTARPGNTTYTFTDGERVLKNIADSAGIDTIDGSQQSTDSIINLAPGTFSSIGSKTVNTLAGEVATEVVRLFALQGVATSLAGWTTSLEGSMNGQDVSANTIYDTSDNDAMYMGQDNISISHSATIENAIGGAGNDTLTGNEADNALKGGLGNDSLNGGNGTDTAIYDGNYADYTITNNGGAITVVDNAAASAGDEGTDRLTNIEAIEFADLTYRSASNDTVATGVSALVSGTPVAVLRSGSTYAYAKHSTSTPVFDPRSSAWAQMGAATTRTPQLTAAPHLETGGLSLLAQESAEAAISVIDVALSTIDSQRAMLGAIANSLTHHISALSETVNNTSAARSRIIDVDYAQEVAKMVRLQLGRQLAESMLQAARVSHNDVAALLK